MNVSTDLDTLVQTAADRLSRATELRRPCPPLRELLPPGDVATAYRVQSAGIARRVRAGASRVGRKIGLTSPAVQAQLGVDAPDFGVLLDDMQVLDGATADYGRLLQPKVEAEVAFRLRRGLDEYLDLATVRDAVLTAHAAIEVVDSRIDNWNISLVDTVADNASSGMFAVSSAGFTLDEIEPRDVTMTLWRNGEVASTGDGTACLGDPLNALLWLARAAAEFGDPLREGDLVLSGALGPMATVKPGDRVAAEISGLGRVHIAFGPGLGDAA